MYGQIRAENFRIPYIRSSLRWFMRVCLTAGILIFLCGVPSAIADDNGDRDYLKRSEDIGEVLSHVKNEEANEATGQVAAWILVAANLNVALSLLIRATTRYTVLSTRIQESLKRLNQRQKKVLMPVHCFFNPLALGIALLHFISASSECSVSILPEWGLILMAIVTGTGIMLKFKLSPKSFRRNTHHIHTHPISIALLLVFLLLGHAVVD